MKLTLDNGRIFELLEIDSPEYILIQEEPFPFDHKLHLEGTPELKKNLYRYKSIRIDGKFYALYKEVRDTDGPFLSRSTSTYNL